MKQEFTKTFTLILGGIILLALNIIPDHDLSGVMAAASGFDFQSVPVVLIGIALVLSGTLPLFKTVQADSESGAKTFVYVLFGGIALSLVSLFVNGSAEIVMKIVAVIALVVGYIQLKKAFEFAFDDEATKGALWVLIGGLLSIYKEVGGGIGFKIIAIVGVVLFFLGLSKLAQGLDEEGAKGAKKIRLALILLVVSTILDMIPLMGLVSGIVAIVAFVVELTGYLRLKQSAAIGEIGTSGAKLLVINMIILVAASFFGIIPFVGSVFVSVLATVSLVLWSVGWMRIEMGTVREEKLATVAA
ncbi:hypothetical protein [uncultured Draconibacterium sp.]|uniref:hypothetical protein n=1 Tax=uncultured Draconibacterium sp. TaxID=1573823 RepID=UPI0032606312